MLIPAACRHPLRLCYVTHTHMRTDDGQARRNTGVDCARGIAVILMIMTHAYGGWASSAAKTTFAYRLTRILGAIPTPLFLLLAGVGLALSIEAAERTEKPLARVQRDLILRGLAIAGYGYLLNLLYALIEGQGDLQVLFRADILHCIGLSLSICALLLPSRLQVSREGGTGQDRLRWRALLLTAAALLFGMRLPSLLFELRQKTVFAISAALFFDVPPFTRFPLLPLIGFCAIGVAIGKKICLGGYSRGRALLLALVSAGCAVFFYLATAYTLRAIGGPLSHQHPAILWNFLDGAARALSVLFLSLSLFAQKPRSPEHLAKSALVRLGRGSLLAYAFHLPFCYGRLAAPIASRLEIGHATLFVLLLIGLTYAVVYGRGRFRAYQRERRFYQEKIG